MNKLTTGIVSGVFALGVLSAALPSHVEAKPMMSERGGMKMMKMMARQLDLSESQREQMKQLLLDAKSQREAKTSEFENYQSQMQAIVQADEFDEAAFEALNTTYQPLMKEKALAKAKMRHAMYQILTEEQKAKMADLKELRSEKRRLKRNRF